MTNAFSEAAWAIVENAILKEKTAENVVVSPWGFSCLFIMVVRHLAEPLADHLCPLLKVNKNFKGPAFWEPESRPPMKFTEHGIVRNQDGTTQGCAMKGLIDKEFPLEPNFRGLTRVSFGATLDEVDFQFGDHPAMVAGVNSWVKEHTDGLLSNVVDNDDVDLLSRLLFVNTRYFKGTWLDPFDPDLTAKGDFHLMDGTTVRVPFMTGCEHFYHAKINNFDLIRIPYYWKGSVSFYIFLPNESGTQEFQQFLHEIGSEYFRVEDFKFKRPSDRDLLIPKFNLHYNTADFPDKFSSVFETPICNAPFKADNIYETDDEDLFLGKILQSCVIKVGESGTEAASATSLSICGASRQAPPPSQTSPVPPLPPIAVDRPFIFMIREEKQQLTYFLGAVTNPLT